MSKELEFSELLVAKLCHDMSGGVSAISHSIEFLDTPNMQAKARELLHSSSLEMIAKLRYYRYAYGISAQEGENDLTQIRTMVSDYFNSSKINLVWQQDAASGFIAITHKACKLLVNMVISAANTMIYGGDLHVELLNHNNKRTIKITAKSKNAVKPLPNFEAILKNHEEHSLDIHNVQIHLLARIAASINMPIISTMEDNCCTLVAVIDHV